MEVKTKFSKTCIKVPVYFLNLEWGGGGVRKSYNMKMLIGSPKPKSIRVSLNLAQNNIMVKR